MKLHPFDEICESAAEWMLRGADVYQQFNCQHCGTKQTMGEKNVMYMKGTCEECGKETDIAKNGCNYMCHFHP